MEPDLVFQLVDNRALNSEVAGANPVEVILLLPGVLFATVTGRGPLAWPGVRALLGASTNPPTDAIVGNTMTEKRFNALGVVGIMIWKMPKKLI